MLKFSKNILTVYCTGGFAVKYQVMLKILMQLLSKRKITAKEIADRY